MKQFGRWNVIRRNSRTYAIKLSQKAECLINTNNVDLYLTWVDYLYAIYFHLFSFLQLGLGD